MLVYEPSQMKLQGDLTFGELHVVKPILRSPLCVVDTRYVRDAQAAHRVPDTNDFDIPALF